MGVDGERSVDYDQCTANNNKGLELFRSVLFRHRFLARLNERQVSVDEFDSSQRMSCDVQSGVNVLDVGKVHGISSRTKPYLGALVYIHVVPVP